MLVTKLSQLWTSACKDFTLPYLALPYLTLPYLTLPYLTLPVLSISTDARRKASATSLREVGYFFPKSK